MFRFTERQFDTFALAAETRFVERVRRFLESDYPEAAGLDEEQGIDNSRRLIRQAQGFGLNSQYAVLSYVSMLLDYFLHDPQGYVWAHELLSATDISEENKLLGLEHRLYGMPLWD